MTVMMMNIIKKSDVYIIDYNCHDMMMNNQQSLCLMSVIHKHDKSN